MPYTDPTESIYRAVGEYVPVYSGTVVNKVVVSNIQLSGTVFYNDQRNILSKSVGNFSKSLEVVQLSGRREHNLSVRNYPITQSISRVKLNGQSDYIMPSRVPNDNVIAVIFSAPGGSDVDANGQRDIESQEYSANNSLNFRNKSARNQLDLDSKTPMTASASTLHGTPENTQYRISSATFSFETRSDNGFIKHQIPYHLDQMSWISQSLLKSVTGKKSHFVYYNEQTGSDYTFTSSMTGSELTKSFGSNYYGIYGYVPWVQTRAGENWRHKIFKNRAYHYVNRRESSQEGKGIRTYEQTVIQSGSFDSSSEGTLIFKEPIIDYSGELSFIRVKDPSNKDLILKTPVFLSKFFNDELNNIYGINEPEKVNYLKPFNRKEFKYSGGEKRQIFPNPKVASLLRTRKRENFIFKGWKDDAYRSSSQTEGGASVNADNTRQIWDPLYAGYTVPSLYAFNYTGSIWPLDSYVHPTMYQTGGKYVLGELMFSLYPELYTSVNFNQRPYYPVASYRFNLAPNSSYRYVLPWTAHLNANSVPFKNSEDVFSLITSKKYKNYGLVPEFNISNKITDANFSNLSKHLFDNSFVFENTGSYFVNKLTKEYYVKDKLSFNINAVLQLRPYNNFYPAFRTLECAKLFSESLASISVYNSVPQGYGLGLNYSYLFIGMLPYFNPGVLYASIKAGMPMPFNFSTLLTSSAIFEFENIFDPYKHIQWKNGLNVPFTESLQTDLYNNAIFNFLAEVKDSFCKNNSRFYFESKPESDYKIFTSGTTYVMDVTLNTGKLDLTSSNITTSGTAVIGGVNYLGYIHNAYTSTVPPWWPGNITSDVSRGFNIVRVSFTPTLTRKYTLDEILATSIVSFHRGVNDLTGNYQIFPKLTSSFNLFEKETDASNTSRWVMRSKWEFPFLAMTGAMDHFSSAISTRQIENVWPEATVEYAGGLWHDYCEVPTKDQGIFLSINDYKYTINGTEYRSASLANMVGFENNKKKRVGELNSNKEIAELLCIVPINKQDDSFFLIDVTKLSGKSLSTEQANVSNTYKLNVELAKKYILPPKLDYTVAGNKPILMFCTEIVDTWSKKDLSYVWQNLLPQNGLYHKEKSLVYEVTDPKDLEMLKDKEVYFMIFKCKQRAASNPLGTYGYNWPYDMCSLVELAQIEMITEDKT